MELQAHPDGTRAAAAAQSWLAAIQDQVRLGIESFSRLGINELQSDIEQRQVNVINTAYLLIILPIWLALSGSYLLAARWPAGLVMTAGVIALSALVLLHSQGHLSLQKYAQFSLPLVFLIPIAVALCLGGHLKSGIVTNWSLVTPLLAILLDKPRTARRWFVLLLAITVGMLLLPGEFMRPTTASALWIKSWQIFNRLGMLTAIYVCLICLHKQHQQAIQQFDTFAAIVSHELSNPLASVGLGLAHLLRQQDRLSTSQQLALQNASQEANRCQLILGDLMALSMGDPHSKSQTITSLDAYPFVLAIGEHLRQRLGVILTIHSPAPAHQRWVVADPRRLHQVIENLIENSAKYSDRQQPVEITIDAGEQQLLIQVADRGAILSSQDCLAMFKPSHPACQCKRQARQWPGAHGGAAPGQRHGRHDQRHTAPGGRSARDPGPGA